MVKIILVAVCLLSQLGWSVAGAAPLDYTQAGSWAYAETGRTESVDCFYKAYPQYRPARSEKGLGVIISFDAEAPSVRDNPLTKSVEQANSSVPCKIVTTNPLTWRTDSQLAPKELNKGACFTNYSGAIEKEIPRMTGAYVDPERHTLKVTDVKAEEYSNKLTLFPVGVYHHYDNFFF